MTPRQLRAQIRRSYLIACELVVKYPDGPVTDPKDIARLKRLERRCAHYDAELDRLERAGQESR